MKPAPFDMPARTYLFVPGNRPERFDKALDGGADAVVLDLEDAVAQADKSTARDAISTWVKGRTATELDRIVLRVNDASSDAFAEDLRLLRDTSLPRAMLAKAESPAHVRELRAGTPAVDVLALIESAQGVAHADALAGCDGVSRLVFGTLDFALDLDIDISDQADGLAFAASRLALASRCAGIAGPVAGVTTQLDDEARLLAELAWARRFGFTAKLCIHPRQVGVVHAALAPSAPDLDWARRVLAADAASPGAARLDGQMIDRPVVLRAQRLLHRAGH